MNYSGYILVFIFLFYPIRHFNIRFSYLIDNLFYPGHQKQKVKNPIFIVGNFRSEMTFLHRLLGHDQESTSLPGWIIYISPSIVGRKRLRFSFRLSSAIGKPEIPEFEEKGTPILDEIEYEWVLNRAP